MEYVIKGYIKAEYWNILWSRDAEYYLGDDIIEYYLEM